MRRFLRSLWRHPPRDRTIDIIAQDQDGNVILGVIDLTDWGSVEKNLMLQERINLCMDVLDSGQLHKEFPNSAGKEVTIRLYYGEQPDEEDSRFLQAVSKQIRSFGVDFECQRYES